ncbi:hypothetical protein ACFFK7_07890 [Pseudoalteromonas xiamenensis]|uniref:hypothetical protein n=1 Tax=Pseudoalteromonas xiamenensis TaxID=882626 RepID=UPI0035E5D283
MRLQRGIALVQILLFVAIFSAIMLYFSKTAKEQIEIAQLVQDRALAELNIHSASQKLYFELLIEDNGFSPYDPQHRKNYFGKAFEVFDDVEVKLFDLSSRLDLRYPNQDNLKALLVYGGLNEEDAGALVRDLLDYQDVDKIGRLSFDENKVTQFGNRNGPLSDIGELRLFELPKEMLELLIDNTSIFKTGSFNPLNASAELLTALYGQQTANEVIALREQTNISKQEFLMRTRIKETEDVFVFTGTSFEIHFSSKVNDIKLNKQVTLQVKPYSQADQSPLNILEIRQ